MSEEYTNEPPEPGYAYHVKWFVYDETGIRCASTRGALLPLGSWERAVREESCKADLARKPAPRRPERRQVDVQPRPTSSTSRRHRGSPAALKVTEAARVAERSR